MFNSIKTFHNEKSTKAFYLSDITTNSNIFILYFDQVIGFMPFSNEQ
ncbi:hypothetical protein [Bacillus toyonensis]|nr:hypothetical protein [Bacillus toyonensis]